MASICLTTFRSSAFRPLKASPLIRSFVKRSIPKWHGGPVDDGNAEKITLTFYNKKKDEYKDVQAIVGSTLLQVAHKNEIDLEGACEGSVACSTCHVILEPEVYDALDEASEEEEDMLDAAFALTETYI